MEKKYLFDYVNDLQDYWAHTKTIEQSEEVLHELLTEHIERTCKYFNLFWQRKNCEEILDKFCNVIWQDVDNELKNEAKLILKEMIKSIPVFHDIGKINIKFQREVMKSPLFKYDKGFNNTRHSMLSAIIYIDYFRYDVLSDLSEELIDILEPFVLYHAYIISRHHSDLNDFEIFTSQLKMDLTIELIDILNNSGVYKKEIEWYVDDIFKMEEYFFMMKIIMKEGICIDIYMEECCIRCLLPVIIMRPVNLKTERNSSRMEI